MEWAFLSDCVISCSLPKFTFPDEVWLRLAKRFKRRRSLNIMVIYMYVAPGWGQTCPWGPFFQNHKLSVHLPISIKFFPSNTILTIFPIQMLTLP